MKMNIKMIQLLIDKQKIKNMLSSKLKESWNKNVKHDVD